MENFKGFKSRNDLVDNFTSIPNELFDRVMSQLKDNELKILLALFRKTYGWAKEVKDGKIIYKTQDEVSQSQFMELTGLSRNTVKKHLKNLVKKGYIVKVREYNDKEQKGAVYKVKQKEPEGEGQKPKKGANNDWLKLRKKFMSRTGKNMLSSKDEVMMRKDINKHGHDIIEQAMELAFETKENMGPKGYKAGNEELGFLNIRSYAYVREFIPDAMEIVEEGQEEPDVPDWAREYEKL